MFYIITISSLWNRQRSCSITSTGHLDAEPDARAVFERALSIAKRDWRARYPMIDADGFTVDFYHVEASRAEMPAATHERAVEAGRNFNQRFRNTMRALAGKEV